jgi:superfamily II DNA or RNA helicase
MIPPIIDELISDTIQTPNMVLAGHSYWLQGKVSGLEIDPDMALIVAEVRGSGRFPYEVTIAFPESDMGSDDAYVECTCPVEFDCKHGAAVLFAVQAQMATRRGPDSAVSHSAPLVPKPVVPLPHSLVQWLADAKNEATIIQRDLPELVYIFSTRAMHEGKSTKGKAQTVYDAPIAQRLTVAVWVKGQETRSPGQQRLYQPSNYELQQRIPMNSTDNWLVRRMTSYSGDFENNGTPKGIAGNDWIEKVVATGRAHWRKADGPVLLWGDDLEARWKWATLGNDGHQRLVLDNVEAGQILLANAPPLVIEEQTGILHRVLCDTSPDLAQRLLSMPPIPPEVVPQIARQWQTIASLGIPEPKLAHVEELGMLQPIPVLNFVQERVDGYLPRRRGYYSSFSLSTQKCDMAISRLSFDYAGYQVIPTTNATEIMGTNEAGLFRFTRDLAAESAAIGKMLTQGLLPLEEFEAIKTKPAQQWDFAPCFPASTIDYARFLQVVVPKLRTQGWRIEFAKKWQLTIAEVTGDSLAFDITSSGTDWFDIALGARIEGKVIDILPMLRMMLTSGGQEWLEEIDDSITIPIGPGKLAQIAADPLKPVLSMLLALALHDRADLARENTSKLRLESTDLAALADLEAASKGRIGWSGADNLRRLARALTLIEIENTKAPASFKADLRPYQQQGLDWLQALHSAGFGGVLADDMGLGKTVQALAHIATLKAANKIDAPVLILCPTSVLPNWQAEINKFVPDLTVVQWHGIARQNRQTELAGADIILTSYPLLLRDGPLFATQKLALIFFDEAHTLKNPKTAGFKAAKALKAQQIVALSGTPVENQLTDLWSLMELVTPGLLGSVDQFKRTIDRPIVRNDDENAKAFLRRRLRPFMLRRTKDEVARDLPEKTEIPEWIDLEKQQLVNYESLRLLMQKRVRDEIARVGLMRSQIVFLDALLKLRQLCCDPRLVAQPDAKAAGSAKLARLMEMLPAMLREGRRIILFSQFTSMLDLIKPELDALLLQYVEITGETSDRKLPVQTFQEGEVPLILVSLKAGGTGLNLTAADTVILYDPWWNPAVEAQAIDRAHRIGQSKPVFVHRLIARGTIEEKILTLQDKKRALAAMLWEGESASPAQLSEDDVAFLLS